MVGFSIPSLLSFFPYVKCIVVMGAKEPDLTPKTMASTLMEVKVCQFGEKFGFMVDILLEMPGKDEPITDKMVTRVTIHEKSLNIGLKIPMLPMMVDLLWWYQLCLA